MVIYFLFNPLNIKQQKFVDVPLLEIKQFTLHELDTTGMRTFMTGSKALRFKNRYEVKNIDFTDNSKEFISNMQAKDGIYKNEIVDLVGDVKYFREDGISFESQTVLYNTRTSIATTDDDYIAKEQNNNMVGRGLRYNSLTNHLESRDVLIKYQLQEGK